MYKLFYFFLCFSILLFIGVHSAKSFNKSNVPVDPISSWKVDKRDRIDMAIVQEWQMTRNPVTDTIPHNQLREARQYKDQLVKTLQISNNFKPIQWEERGPNNIAGRTRTILIDHSDPTTNNVFVGSVAGGLWKSNQANQEKPNWTRNKDIPNNVPITSIAQHPINPEIMYCATGEGYYNIEAAHGNGIYKSTDQGNSWDLLESTTHPNFAHIQKIIVGLDGSLLVGTRINGIMLSINGGVDFKKVLGKNKIANKDAISDIELASNGDIFAAAGLFEADGIYKSSDNGKTWLKLRKGLPESGFNRIELACAQSNSGYVYAILNNENTNNCMGIFRSTDGGQHWLEVNNPEMSAGVNFLRRQGWYNMSAAVDPWDESTLYIGGIDLFRTQNAGMSFQQISHWYGEFGLPTVHADQHAIAFGRNSDNIFFGNDGGIARTNNATNETFSINPFNEGYNVTQFYSADFHPTEKSHIICAGAQDNGTQLFSEIGMNSTKEITGGDGAFTHIDQTDGNTIISSYVFNNYRISRDGGKTHKYCNFGNTGKFINPTDFDDQTNILYASNLPGKLLRYCIDSTQSQYEELDLVGLNDQQITAITLSPNIKNRLYIGTDGGDLYKIDNANKSKNLVVDQLFEGRGYLSAISIEEKNEDQLIISYSNYGISSVYQSDTGGKTWNAIEGNLPNIPVRSCVIDPSNSHRILLATDLGVWMTSNAEAEYTEWEPLFDGMESVRVDMLKFRQSDNMLLAATHGRGVFTTDYFVFANKNL